MKKASNRGKKIILTYYNPFILTTNAFCNLTVILKRVCSLVLAIPLRKYGSCECRLALRVHVFRVIITTVYHDEISGPHYCE